MTTVPFSYIPANLLVPGFFFEVQPLDNTALLQFQTLMMGQVLSTGSLGPTTVAASAAAASGETVHFTSVPTNIVPGMTVIDLTTSAAIPSGTTVVSTTSTTVVLSAAVTSGGVLSADEIQFYPQTAPILVSTVNQAIGLFGPGSMLANMVSAYRTIDSIGTLYCLPLVDAPASVKATGQINITGTVSAASVLSLYVAGIPVPVNLSSSMTNANIAVALVNAVNATPNLPVVASGSTFPVTLTALNAGVCGNDIDIRINYYGTQNNEVTPTGLTVVITPMASGAVNPDLAVGLASLGSTPFNVFAGPYVDENSLSEIKTFLDDATGRWSYLQELFGHYFTVANQTVSNLVTLGTGQNYQHTSIMGVYQSPTPPYAITAALAANASVSLRADPGTPLNTLPLTGALSPTLTALFTIGDRQTLLAAGIGTCRSDSSNNLIIDRIVTTYTTNQYSQPDDSYQNVEKMFCIAYTISYTASILSGLYSRVKLAQDGTRVPVGSNIVTPSVVAGSLISIYGDLCDAGICQNFQNFTQNVFVTINNTNPNRLDIIMPITPIYQLDTMAIALQLVL